MAGIGVRGIPRGEDNPWSSWVVTGCDGTFRLTLTAPGSDGFQLLWNKTSVITASPQDPARLEIPLVPGERRGGVEVVFLEALWRSITESAAIETPPCP